MMRRLSLAVALALSLAACGPHIKPPPDVYQVTHRFVGMPVDQLLINWGPPQSAFDLTDGGKVLEYRNYCSFAKGGNTVYIPFGSGSNATYFPITKRRKEIHLFCAARFQTNAAGMIVDVKVHGNDCKPN